MKQQQTFITVLFSYHSYVKCCIVKLAEVCASSEHESLHGEGLQLQANQKENGKEKGEVKLESVPVNAAGTSLSLVAQES